MSENNHKGLNGVFRNGAAGAGAGAGSLAAGRHVERQKRSGTFSALGRLGGSLRPSLGDDETQEDGTTASSAPRGSIAAEVEKFRNSRRADAAAAAAAEEYAAAPAASVRADEADESYHDERRSPGYPGPDDDEGDGGAEDAEVEAALPANRRPHVGTPPRADLPAAAAAATHETDTALVTVLPQDSLERVRFSADRTDGEFIHLYAALERHLQELYDAAAIEAASDPDVTLPTVFGITSSVAGEGKTSVAMHLALMVARNTFKRVCLIDMSLGDDDISRRLGAHVEKGVMDVLEGHDYMIRTIQVEECGDLSVMPAGKAPENAVRAARSPAVPEVIAAARQMFDLILVDMPPVTSGNALPIAAHVDRVMMVVNAGVTPRGLVNEAIEQIGRQRVLGVVLNKIKRASPGWVQRRFGYF